MKMLLFSIFALTLTVNSKELSGQALVDFVDTNEEPLWVAKSIKPFLKSATPDEEEQFRVMDVKFIEIPPGTPTLEEEIKKINKIPEGIDPKSGKSFIAKEPIPQFFDARQKWPQCYTIGSIKQQSNCGSCWAVASAAVASDRMCINPPHYQMSLSAEDILSCCGRQCYPQEACLGGYPIRAMNWWVTNGIVTGGDYNDRQYCRPYTIPPCGYHNGTFQSCPPLFSAPRCHQQCQKGYQRNYTQDKYYASRAYHVPGDITTIQREIMEHGPVVATFIVYEDFRRYQRGIYHHTWGIQKGGHVVKIIGWGVEDQIPYWLAVNSWGTGWGDKGLFKILRGNNECGFEAAIVAALPRS